MEPSRRLGLLRVRVTPKASLPLTWSGAAKVFFLRIGGSGNSDRPKFIYVFEPQAHYDQLLRWWYYGLEVSGADGG